jgi:hypothetical protein
MDRNKQLPSASISMIVREPSTGKRSFAVRQILIPEVSREIYSGWLLRTSLDGLPKTGIVGRHSLVVGFPSKPRATFRRSFSVLSYAGILLRFLLSLSGLFLPHGRVIPAERCWSTLCQFSPSLCLECLPLIFV